jgi:hypothetical protein
MTVSVIPQFDVMRTPPIIFSICGEIRPKTPTFSLFAGGVPPATAFITNGIIEKWVMSCLATISQYFEADHFGIRTMVPPTPSVVHVDQLCALTWK